MSKAVKQYVAREMCERTSGFVRPPQRLAGKKMSRDETASTGEKREEVFVLQDQNDVFRLDPADLDRARAIQSQVRAWEENDPRDSSGGISINIAPCRIGDGPAPDATVSFAIQTRPDGPFEPLLRNGRLSQVAGADDLAKLPAC